MIISVVLVFWFGVCQDLRMGGREQGTALEFIAHGFRRWVLEAISDSLISSTVTLRQNTSHVQSNAHSKP